jgi:hypothetical protein
MKKAFLMIVAGLLCVTESFAAHAACDPKQAGATVDCPIFTEPAFTSVPGASMGGTLLVGPGATTLFNGAVPPNGFMVQINDQGSAGNICYVSDNGPAQGSTSPHIGFMFGGVASTVFLYQATPLFVSPTGYKPMGPVSVWCPGSLYIEARGGEIGRPQARRHRYAVALGVSVAICRG